MNCDCKIYHYLMYLNAQVDEIVPDKFRISTGPSTCSEPAELKDINFRRFLFKEFKCQTDQLKFVPQNLCTLNEKCYCQYRPYDKTLFVNCSASNLEKAPKFKEFKNINRIEIFLGQNNLKEIPDMREIGYDLVELLDLSYNSITNITENILYGNLKVSKSIY